MTSSTRFIILAAPRTGSNLLCTLLNSHPEVLCHHELFNPEGIFYALDYRDGSLHLGNMAERDREPFAFLRRVWENTQGASCAGFKMTRGQNDAVMRSLIEDPGILKIVLYRKNRIKTFVSELAARQTGQWEVYAGDEVVTDTPKIRVDVESLKAHADLNERFYDDIRHSLKTRQQPCIEMFYENIFSRSGHVRLLEFLGVDATQVRLAHSSIKQNDSDLRNLVENFDELEVALEGSGYLAELYDHEN
jgi:LPS sulfotransferase NodH